MLRKAAVAFVFALSLGGAGCSHLRSLVPLPQAVFVPDPPPGIDVSQATLLTTADTLRRRLSDAPGAIVKVEAGRIVVSMSASYASLLAEVTRTGDLRFLLMPANLEPVYAPPGTLTWLDKTTRQAVPTAQALKAGTVILRGSDFAPNARLGKSDNGPHVFFELRANRQAWFREWSRQHIGRCLVIALDDELLEAPVITEALPGMGVIEGSLSREDCRYLVRFINSGPLPVPLRRVDAPPTPEAGPA